MTTTTPPPPSSLPLPGTPVHPRSGDKDTFAPKYDDRDLLFSRLSAQMSPYFVGPVPPDTFLQSFLPINTNATFTRGMFSALKDSDSEGEMYKYLVDAVKLFIPELSMINTAHKKDRLVDTAFSLECQPDCTVVARNAINPPSGFDSSRAEFFIEFKTRSESDPFRSSKHVATMNPYMEKLPMDMATGRRATQVAGQITAYASLILSSQYRTHTFFVIIIGDYARLLRWDRGGAVVSAPIMYNEDSHLFDFLVRYNHATREMRGHDITINTSTAQEEQEARTAVGELEQENGLLTVAIENQHYVIRAPCAQPEVPVGRWTRTSVAYSLQRKERVFLKDSWRIVHQDIIPEGMIYAKLHQNQVHNVPHCLNCGDIGGVTYHTTQTRNFIRFLPEGVQSRVITHRHYRLVLDTVGRPLHDFKKSKDMVRAIHAALIAHEQAYDAGVLHRDISAGNILIVEEAKSNIEFGMLIDWDLSKMVIQGSTMGVARQHTRTGTWQFMAADLIENSTIPHTFVHDLESTFWVLIWIVVSYMESGWGATERSSFLKDAMCPMVYGDEGGSSKTDFIMGMRIPPVPKATVVYDLLRMLSHLFGPRHKKRQAQQTYIPQYALGGGPVEPVPPIYEMFPEGLSNHSKILQLFSRSLEETNWPDDDAALLQPKLPSAVELRAMRTGSIRSRSQAEKSGVYVLPP